jgi:hypothetical protein
VIEPGEESVIEPKARCDIRQRTQGDQVVPTRFGGRDLEEDLDRIVARGWTRRLRQCNTRHAVLAVYELSRLERPPCGASRTHMDRDIAAATQVQRHDRVANRAAERDVARNYGYRPHLNARITQSEDESDCIVGCRIRIDNQTTTHTDSLPPRTGHGYGPLRPYVPLWVGWNQFGRSER